MATTSVLLWQSVASTTGDIIGNSMPFFEMFSAGLLVIAAIGLIIAVSLKAIKIITKGRG